PLVVSGPGLVAVFFSETLARCLLRGAGARAHGRGLLHDLRGGLRRLLAVGRWRRGRRASGRRGPAGLQRVRGEPAPAAQGRQAPGRLRRSWPAPPVGRPATSGAGRWAAARSAQDAAARTRLRPAGEGPRGRACRFPRGGYPVDGSFWAALSPTGDGPPAPAASFGHLELLPQRGAAGAAAHLWGHSGEGPRGRCSRFPLGGYAMG
ncbi:unnamed protein product, partial [Prorocentrum cordatum]